MKVGVARGTITGDGRYRLAGVAGRAGGAVGVHDDLQATALWLQGRNGEEAALVSLDLIGVPAGWSRALAHRIGLPECATFCACSHTHSGPVSMPLLDEADERYLTWLADHVAALAHRAAERLCEVKVERGISACDIGVSRRLIVDGHCAFRPNLAGTIDRDVTVLRFVANASGEVARIVHFSCHPTVLGVANRRISRDYVGYARDAVEAEPGSGLCLFLQGSCGDARPFIASTDGHFREGTFGDAWALGQALASAVRDAASLAVPVSNSHVRTAARPLRLSLRDPGEPARLTGDRCGEAVRFWLQQFEAQYHGMVPKGAHVELTLQALEIGEIHVLFIPAEVFAATGQAFKRLDPNVLVGGYTNGNVGYIPTAQALTEGGYEVEQAYKYYGYPSSFDARAEATLIATGTDLLREMVTVHIWGKRHRSGGCGRINGMTLDEEVAALRAENALLRAELAAAQARIAELEKRKTPAPGFVKAHTERKESGQPRKKRDPQHNAGRGRAEPTQTIQHAYERCPDCGYLLRGQSIARTREVIDLPPPPPVVVTEHQILKRFCPVCQRWQVPAPDWSGQVLGQGRLGVRLVSLIAYLRTEARLPVRTIQEYLATLHQVHLSTGAVVNLLDRLREATAAERAPLLAQARASPIAQMDETGWREDGQNGQVWGLTTPGPEPVRYYHYAHSRAGEVATDLLGDFDGHLVSDFYGGYNAYTGKHQRCWTHLLRDLHDLKTAQADNAEVVVWAQDVRALYDEAQAALQAATPLTPPQRETLYRQLEDRAHLLGLAHAGVANKAHPCHALGHRLLRHQGELFQFVRVPGLSADNNAAERMLRPLVITRKISGGSRTPAGTATRMALSTLFGTWKARGLNTFHACLSMLHSALPQI